jgi:hypothetical protein
MRLKLFGLILLAPIGAAVAQNVPPASPRVVEKPAALTADGIPPVPAELAERTRPYMEFRTATFTSWNPRDRSMTIMTRFANTAQVHRVARPMGAREQLSFEAEPLSGGWSPNGDVLLVRKDIGGNEFFQLYTLANGRLSLLTDGQSRNELGAWSRDGSLIGYSSTRRNGSDSDLYVMNPRDRSTDRMVAQVRGGGWGIVDFSPDNARAVVIEYVLCVDHQVQPPPARPSDRADDADRRSQKHNRLRRSAICPGRQALGDFGRRLGVPAARHR